MSEKAPAARREKVEPRYLPAWDLCQVAFNMCPVEHKPVWWACFEAARALGTLGDSEGRTADPAAAEQHLLEARKEADRAQLLVAGVVPSQRQPGYVEQKLTPLAEALDSALATVRQLLQPAAPQAPAAPAASAAPSELETLRAVIDDVRREAQAAIDYHRGGGMRPTKSPWLSVGAARELLRILRPVAAPAKEQP